MYIVNPRNRGFTDPRLLFTEYPLNYFSADYDDTASDFSFIHNIANFLIKAKKTIHVTSLCFSDL